MKESFSFLFFYTALWILLHIWVLQLFRNISSECGCHFCCCCYYFSMCAELLLTDGGKQDCKTCGWDVFSRSQLEEDKENDGITRERTFKNIFNDKAGQNRYFRKLRPWSDWSHLSVSEDYKFIRAILRVRTPCCYHNLLHAFHFSYFKLSQNILRTSSAIVQTVVFRMSVTLSTQHTSRTWSKAELNCWVRWRQMINQNKIKTVERKEINCLYNLQDW